MIDDPIYTVSDSDLLEALPDELRTWMTRAAVASSFAADHLFYAADDDAERVFVLWSGRVRVYKLSPEGRSLTLLVLEAPAIFGEMALASMPTHDSFAEAMTACRVGSIRNTDLQDAIARFPGAALRFTTMMSRRLRAMERKLADIAFKSVAQRLATVLLSLTDSHDTRDAPAVVRYTHQQLAEMIGSYRETITKVIGEFREQGLIRVEDDAVYLTDLPALRAIVGVVH